MKDELTINQNYVLRKGLDDQYSLYNKSIQKRYELSYKLFFILNLFRIWVSIWMIFWFF